MKKSSVQWYCPHCQSEQAQDAHLCTSCGAIMTPQPKGIATPFEKETQVCPACQYTQENISLACSNCGACIVLNSVISNINPLVTKKQKFDVFLGFMMGLVLLSLSYFIISLTWNLFPIQFAIPALYFALRGFKPFLARGIGFFLVSVILLVLMAILASLIFMPA
jgi:hypothetical protein